MSTPAGPLQYFRAGYVAPRHFTRARYPKRRSKRDFSVVPVIATTSASTTATTSMSTSASTTRSTTTATAPPPVPPFDFDDDFSEPVIGGEGVRSRFIFLKMLRVNNAGDYAENPVIEGVRFTAVLHKHNAEDAFLKCWTTIDDEIVSDLTDEATEEDEEVSVSIMAGEDLRAGFPAVLNVIHFTTSSGHTKGGIWCASTPPAMVLLDGYNANDPELPAVLRIEEE